LSWPELARRPNDAGVDRATITGVSPLLSHCVSHEHIAVPVHCPNGLDTIGRGRMYGDTTVFGVGARPFTCGAAHVSRPTDRREQSNGPR
jgi:hypothetical protein